MQPMQQYYQQIGVSGDLSYLNLPQKPITTIPKLIDIMVNGMINRDYSIVANSIDPSIVFTFIIVFLV